uniref:DNA-directed RNA polymerases I, II, and III subunit RPABC3 n=1 Tax=Mantoniella antarctica TaxID=81844 RepID=A0A7S0S905_9CHLO|mmetsp:Transcript_21875/g.35449  ORF Transcript_21875/g.35449 Transcript_21875/m.35449 type:complete len:152 (-) Transcript_21875:409-864(-)|eukprot:CAMPEP_0181369766 /NCGR_PEP_ID=MMETSP1106-20121128/12990_1 /TAXON_ID=81844 /ORGANISM="Mantoniella antarctica, Strain SL-175" /LENGTH=151 /DNA_ID=CAMNT_0023486359 /DNA_START=109 /DNA_END=564 /DNA_ORIENTATION=-
MASAGSGGVVAYEDLFEVIDRDADGKKFDKVSRFKCRSQFEAELQIDINVDIYKLEIGTRFTLVLAPTLSLDGTPEDASYDQSGKESLADGYEYVMYGKVYKKEDENSGGIQKAAVNISFGGLLMHLRADPKNLQDVDIDNRLYVLIRKIS